MLIDGLFTLVRILHCDLTLCLVTVIWLCAYLSLVCRYCWHCSL